MAFGLVDAVIAIFEQQSRRTDLKTDLKTGVQVFQYWYEETNAILNLQKNEKNNLLTSLTKLGSLVTRTCLRAGARSPEEG